MTVRQESQESQVMKRINDLDINLSRVARFVGVRRATVSSWVNAGTLPNLDPAKMQRLSIALECESYSEMVLLFQPQAFKLSYELRKEWESIKIL